MSRRQMRFAEQDEDDGIGMAFANLGNLDGGMPVAGANLAQVFTWHAVEAVKRFGVIARRDQKFVERSPVVSPVEVEADALAQFGFVDLAPPPLIKNVLVAGKDGFHTEHHRAVARQCTLLDE